MIARRPEYYISRLTEGDAITAFVALLDVRDRRAERFCLTFRITCLFVRCYKFKNQLHESTRHLKFQELNGASFMRLSTFPAKDELRWGVMMPPRSIRPYNIQITPLKYFTMMRPCLTWKNFSVHFSYSALLMCLQ